MSDRSLAARVRRVAAGLALLALLPGGAVWARARPASELTVAMSGFSTEVLDPILGGHSVKFYLALMFDYLIGVTPDGQLSRETGIARDWKPSPDYRRWTFTLRRGIRFHNGDELTSADVKFSILRAIGKRSTTGYAGVLRQLLQDIETPAPDTVVLVTKEPTLIIPPYLSRALSTEGMVLPKKYIEANGDDAFAQRPVGSGPYRFVEHITGSHITLEAVDRHWRIGVPRYQTVTFRVIPEEATRMAMVRRGEVDIADVSRDRVAEMERAGFPIRVRRDDALLHLWWILPWDRTPVRNKRVREALNLAIDREEVAATIFGGRAEPAAIQLGLTWAFRDVKFRVTPDQRYPFDPARAKKLLAEAGFPNGFPIELFAYQLPGLPEGKSMAEAVGGYWQKIGVKPRLIPVDYPAFRKQWVDRVTPGAVGYYNLPNRDWIGAYTLLEKFAYAPAGPTTTLADPEIDAMLGTILRQTNREKINALMRSVFTRLRSEHYGIPLVYLHTPYVTGKRITRWNPGSVMMDLNLDELLGQR
jgi:peptide/nickel transport system substrate-binding protein